MGLRPWVGVPARNRSIARERSRMLARLRLLRRIRRFPLLAETAFALLRASLRVRLGRFGRVAEELARPVSVTDATSDAGAAALEVRGLIHAVCRRLPARPACLVRAVAAHQMLTRRGVGSTVVLSVSPSGRPGIKAHAWLEAAGTVVTGRSEMAQFTAIHRIGNAPVAVPGGDSRCLP